MRNPIIAIGLIFVVVLPASAQTESIALSDGARVRVVGPAILPQVITGVVTLGQTPPGTLRIVTHDGDARIDLQLPSLGRVQVSRGRPRWRDAGAGLAIGLVGGAVIGAQRSELR